MVAITDPARICMMANGSLRILGFVNAVRPPPAHPTRMIMTPRTYHPIDVRNIFKAVLKAFSQETIFLSQLSDPVAECETQIWPPWLLRVWSCQTYTSKKLTACSDSLTRSCILSAVPCQTSFLGRTLPKPLQDRNHKNPKFQLNLGAGDGSRTSGSTPEIS